jgi:hypothetical protein
VLDLRSLLSFHDGFLQGEAGAAVGRGIPISIAENHSRNAALCRGSDGLQDASRHRHGRRLCADHGDDHVGAARRGYADRQIYEWLLRFRARA